MKEVLLSDAVKAKGELELLIKNEIASFTDKFGVIVDKVNFLYDEVGEYDKPKEYHIKLIVLI